VVKTLAAKTEGTPDPALCHPGYCNKIFPRRRLKCVVGRSENGSAFCAYAAPMLFSVRENLMHQKEGFKCAPAT
jgi:hypothetical protein